MLALQNKHILLYLLSPFLLLIISIRNYKSKYFPGILYLFCLFYGFTFTVASELFDADRILLNFSEASQDGFLEFTGISRIFATGNTQVVENVIVWFVANTFESSQVLFLIYASIFGYFYVANYNIIIKLYTNRNSFFDLTLLLTFVMLIPIWEINGWRMWTASHIFFYSVYNLIHDNRQFKFYLFLFLTPFIHFSFWILIVPILLFIVFKSILNRIYLFPIFVLTLFMNPLDIEKSRFESTVDLEFARAKIIGYGNSEYLERIKEKESQLVFHAKYYKTALHVGLMIIFIYLVFNFSQGSRRFDLLLKWTLFFGISVNLISLLPFADMSRFRMIHYLFMIYIIVYIIKRSYFLDNSLLYKFAHTPVIILLLFYNIVEIRKGFDRFGIATLVTNPITVLFFPHEDNTALIHLIK